MAVKIRMRQQGRKNRQTFRLVVTDIRNPRDGKYVETLGSYDPHQKTNNFSLNAERLSYWLGKGATLSERAEKMVKSVAPQLIKELQEKRNAKRVKEAAKRRGKKEKTVKAAATEEASKKKKAKTKDES